MADIEGLERALAEIQRIAQEKQRDASAGLYAEAEAILADAKGRTPVDTGALRSSGRVVVDGDRLEVAFGGPAAGYAIAVHEDLDAHHDVGGSKFLEKATLDAVPGLAARVGRHVKR